jgi:hypothetical protein
MKSVRVDKPHWQIACWKLALAKKSFEVVGFSDRHQPFSDHLCSAFGYEVKRGLKKSVFSPPASKTTSVHSLQSNADTHLPARPQKRI